MADRDELSATQVADLIEHGGMALEDIVPVFKRAVELLRTPVQPVAQMSGDAVETAAKAIYEKLDYTERGTRPAWLDGGNSLKQDEARKYAKAALAATVPQVAQSVPSDKQFMSLEQWKEKYLPGDKPMTLAETMEKVIAETIGDRPKAAKNANADCAKRLRLLCRMLGLENAIPDDDAQLMDCQFSVFGMMRSKLESLTTASNAGEAAQGADK